MKKNILLFLLGAVFISFGMRESFRGEIHTSNTQTDSVSGNVDTVSHKIRDSFVIGGYSAVKDGITTYLKTDIRYCSKHHLTEGIYKFKGHLRLVASPTIKRIKQINKEIISYEVNGRIDGCYVKYDENAEITIFEIYSDEPFVLSLGKEDNTSFKSGEFELLSYTPYEKNDLYNVKIRSINPCVESSRIIKYHEPTMVIAGDGVIIIAAYCEDTDGKRSVLNTVSTDGGITWKTNWTSGILTMAWDRINHRLCGVRAGVSYVSYDYGMTWEKIGSYDHSYVTEEMNSVCLNYRIKEKEAYMNGITGERYSYIAQTANIGNSGIQLENGVICMPMVIRLRKRLAGKDDNQNWILDSEGYCKPLNSEKTVGYENVVAYVLYSKDFGITWDQSPTTPLDYVCDETCLTEVKPNQVCMNSRGGTEYFWSTEPSIRRVHIQKTPVADRLSFAIDAWDADWGTRPQNTIEDALVNADVEKVKHFRPSGTNGNMTFWLFCSIYNPNSFARKGLMLRLSPDCRNWNNVGYLTPSNKLIGGYCEMGADSSHIYIVFEGNRDRDPLSFSIIDNYMLEDLMSAYRKSKKTIRDIKY